MESHIERRMLLGINISIFGVILGLAGGGPIAIAVGVIGLATSALSLLQEQRAP